MKNVSVMDVTHSGQAVLGALNHCGNSVKVVMLLPALPCKAYRISQPMMSLTLYSLKITNQHTCYLGVQCMLIATVTSFCSGCDVSKSVLKYRF